MLSIAKLNLKIALLVPSKHSSVDLELDVRSEIIAKTYTINFKLTHSVI